MQGTRGASSRLARSCSEEGSGLAAHREALGPRGRTSWRGEGALSGGRAGAGGGGSGAEQSCLHPWHGAAAAAGARLDPLGHSPAQSVQTTRRGPASTGPGAPRRQSGRAAGGRPRCADSRAHVLPAGALAGHAPGARRRGPRGLPPPRAPRSALERPGPPLSTPLARPDPSGRRADGPQRCWSPRGDGLMGAAGRRMRWAPARLLLPLLQWLLLLAPEIRGAPGCPVPIRSCKCSGERPKGLSGGAPSPARRRVVCGGGDLPEPPEPGLLPNSTVTL